MNAMITKMIKKDEQNILAWPCGCHFVITLYVLEPLHLSLPVLEICLWSFLLS